jgi:MerR family transcriptional regulator, light-induced transcriptional regulator
MHPHRLFRVEHFIKLIVKLSMEVKGKYSIKDLEVLSGIKAHTLRIWEQRYKLVVPYRTETNIRYYTDSQLKLILNIAALNNSGVKISKIAELSKAEIGQKVLKLDNPELKNALLVNRLLEGMIELDKQKILAVMHDSSKFNSLMEFFTSVVFPFLGKVGQMWSSEGINPAQEHFASNIIKRFLMEKIEKLEEPKPDAAMYLLFLPEGDWHELSLLVAEYVLKKSGKKVMYLGASVPDKDIEKIVRLSTIDFMLCVSILSQPLSTTQETINRFAKVANKVSVIFAGRSFYQKELTFPSNCDVLYKFEELAEL